MNEQTNLVKDKNLSKTNNPAFSPASSQTYFNSADDINSSLEIVPDTEVPYVDYSLFPEKLVKTIIQLHLKHERQRQLLLADRQTRQAFYDQGGVPTFEKNHPAKTTTWKVAAIPHDLLDRRVEITGPISSTKMVINMLNPNQDGETACTAMLDFEDSMAPTWGNVLSGLHNIIGVAQQNLCYEQETAQGVKKYELNTKKMAVPMVRVRGLHMNETHIRVNEVPVSAGMFDLVSTIFHTAELFIAQNRTPKFYIPKCEHYLEARWWNSVITDIEASLGLKHGTIRITMLIETLPAAFCMEEILFETKERICGLNVGRWDKIFSDIKTLRNHKDRIMANRATIDMLKPWMANYAQLLVKTCHKHGAMAIGGMSAFTPGQEASVREAQTAKVIQDKRREADLGHDGCWVSHPYFITLAKAQFTKINQLEVMHEDFSSEPDLLPQSVGPKTIEGLRQNIRVGIAYTQGWLSGLGCIAFDNLMEDLATLEISRAQVWQWLHHQVVLDDGTPVNEALIHKLFNEELEKIIFDLGITDQSVIASYTVAKEKAEKVFLKTKLDDFFTLK